MKDFNGSDPLAEWCAKEMRLNIDGKELIIKPTMEHYRILRKLLKEKSMAYDELREVFRQILFTTFPNSVSVDDFLERYENKFQIALMAEIMGVPVDELKKNFFRLAVKES